MIKISKQDWDKFKRDNDPEIFAKSFIDSMIEANRELLEKAETSELNDEEKVYVDNFRTELSHFTPVEVMGENPDKLQKSLKHDIYFIREKQVDWDETIEKSEDGEDYSFGTFRNTPLNNKLGRVGNLIEKGKRGQLGEVREWKGGKYKKTSQGWVPVSEGKEKDQPSKEELLDKIGKVLGYSNVSESQILSWRGNNLKAEKLIDKYKDMFINKEESKESKEESKNQRINLDGITWEVTKRGETQSKVTAVTASVKGKERIVDNKVIDRQSSPDKEPEGKKDKNDSKLSEFKVGDELIYNAEIDGTKYPVKIKIISHGNGYFNARVNEPYPKYNPGQIRIDNNNLGKFQKINDKASEDKESGINKKKRNLWIADRADELAKDHPDKSNDQLLRMAGKEWANLETPDVNPSGHSFGEPSKRPESEKVITAKELNKIFSNVEDWGDLGDRVSVDGDKLEVVNPYFYGGKNSLSSLKNDWTGSDGWMSKYLKKEYGIKLTVDSEDLQDKASGKYKKFGKNMGVAILKLKIEKA